MYETEYLNRERPTRATRVVPMEPSLCYRYSWLICIVCAVVLAALNSYITFKADIFMYSFFNAGFLASTFLSLFYIFPLKPWKTLDQRRQQAARYHLATGLLTNAGAQSRTDASDLPEHFVLSLQRNLKSSWITGFVYSFVFFCACIILYQYGQTLLQDVQNGIASAAIIWELSLNTVIVIICGYFFFYSLVVSPRQRLLASREGLSCQRGYRTDFIPWHEARLFALIGQERSSGKEPVLFYELAGAQSAIRWPSANRRVDQGLGSRVPIAITLLRTFQARSTLSEAEFAQQIQFLNIIVAERTGLPLYDLRNRP